MTEWMKVALFYAFLLVFLATAVITLCGILEKCKIRETYLSGLYRALLLEVVAVVIALFATTDFFLSAKSATELTQKAERLATENGELRRLNESFQIDFQNLKGERDSLQKQLTSLKDTNGRITAQSASLKEWTDELRGYLDALAACVEKYDIDNSGAYMRCTLPEVLKYLENSR